MVDVSTKPATDRVARATGAIRMLPNTLALIRRNELAKGDVLVVAKLAGIMAAKRTADLIPLCHPLALTDVQITLEPDDSLPGLRAEATVRTMAQTGVEMEAITAVAVTLITVYDMAKAVDRRMTIGDICLLEKSGGQSGGWQRG
ncbi:MAG: cyclic pyranopterin monophosphate synthase MoaC [Gemmatimonadota bacterium]|nr:cyclic pyranopterin monophosphate synthase MoaC [Gemmatimonadota bacterium]